YQEPRSPARACIAAAPLAMPNPVPGYDRPMTGGSRSRYGGLHGQPRFEPGLRRIDVGSQPVDQRHGDHQRDRRADQRRVVRPGEVVDGAADVATEARSQAEQHEAKAIDLAESALSEIARRQKGDQVDLG